MTDYMVTGLVKRRGELAGEIKATHEALRKMVDDLETIDGALRLVAPELEVEAIRPKQFRPPADWSQRGQMTRVVLSILRQSRDMLTTREVAAQMLLERAMNADDVKLLRMMTRRVAAALREQRDRGSVRWEQGPGQYGLWEIAR